MIYLSATILSIIIFCNHRIISKFFNLYDYPDKNLKKHDLITAPNGGVFIFLIFLISFSANQINSNTKFFFFSSIFESVTFILFSFIVLFYGIIDDKIRFRSEIKSIVFLTLFTFFCFFSNDATLNYFYTSLYSANYNLGKLSIPFSIFCYMSFTQAFNMYDGLDRQSGLLALLHLLFFFYVSNFSIFFIYILIPIIFFLIFNRKGKLFLGNGGSNFLSFFIGYIAIRLAENGALSAEYILILFAIPGYELLRLFIERILKKKNPLKGDLNHIHHLAIKKFTYLQSLIIILSLTIIPVLGILINVQIYFIIIFQLISYVLFITYVKIK